jgi:hypothetical protein
MTVAPDTNVAFPISVQWVQHPMIYARGSLHSRLTFVSDAMLPEFASRNGRSDQPTTPSHAIAWSRFTAFSA